MKRLKQKLQSQTGSSLIIALLFTMICVFVGGAVLVSASVNGGRLNGRREREQGILNQRSLATVLVNQLEDEDRMVDLVLPIMTNSVTGLLEPAIPDEASPLEKAIFKAAEGVYKTNNKAKAEFTAEYPNGEKVCCTATCYPGYEVRISFEEVDSQNGAGNSQVELVLRGTGGTGSIQWYGCEIVKAVNG